MGIFRRRKPAPEALDQTGAATSYPHRSGATPPPPERPAKATNPGRNASHVTGFAPRIEPGQLAGEDSDR